MGRPTRCLCTGTALHFFDAGLGQRGSDKFYRAFKYDDGEHWNVIMCWGRDGTQGQSKVEQFTNQFDAQRLIDKKIAEKMRHGYEKLGQGTAVLDTARRMEVIGAEFADSVAQRDPDKTRMTGGFIIHEEPGAEDLMELLG